nr:hypothetical protein [Escherichia coli]MCU6964018.1 hypothetical protein [Escherichia coli]
LYKEKLSRRELLAFHSRYKLQLLAHSQAGYKDMGPFVAAIHEWADWICPYISRHLLSLNPLLACCRRYSR